MNWDQVEGKWKQYKGQVKEKWGKLTDDDLDVIDGKRQQLVGKIQERYGIARDAAEKQADEFVNSIGLNVSKIENNAAKTPKKRLDARDTINSNSGRRRFGQISALRPITLPKKIMSNASAILDGYSPACFVVASSSDRISSGTGTNSSDALVLI